MKLFSTTTTTTTTSSTSTSTSVKNTRGITVHPFKTHVQASNFIKLNYSIKRNGFRITSSWNPSANSSVSSSTTRAATDTATKTWDSIPSSSSSKNDKHHWMVVMEKPDEGLHSKSEFVDYYVRTLAKVLGSEKEAQMCIYNTSWQTHFGFCCDVDEETSRELARLPEVLSVSPDPDIESVEKDYNLQNVSLGRLSNSNADTFRLFSERSTKYWLVRMEKPAVEVVTKAQMVDHYAQILAKVLRYEKDAQMCIYHVSWQNNIGFCCELDEESAKKLADVPGVLSVQSDKNFGSENKDYGGLPEVLSVRPDPDIESVEKDYSLQDVSLGRLSNSNANTSRLFSERSTKYWLVRMEKPAVEVVTKAQMVDHYAQILAKVLGYEKDAQMCIYHVSWQNNFGFCCELDEESAKKLAGVPGVQSVQSDKNFGSENKDYGGDEKSADSSDTNRIVNIKTKRLFVTGLSFYTSEKTLRASFEGFGELVEVKIIMDKISKRSKGYAFIEYTTEEAAGAALTEMNGKIINGWMIVVDVAKTNPPKFTRGHPRPIV